VLARLTPITAIGLVLLAGCGSDYGSGSGSGSGSSSSSGAQKLALEADPGGKLRFDRSKLTADPGAVTITLDNPKSSGATHGVGVEGNGVDEDGESVPAGGTSTVTVDLKPGTYTFYCPVPGHEDAGMKGTLTVGEGGGTGSDDDSSGGSGGAPGGY
jgi:plastocyanin